MAWMMWTPNSEEAARRREEEALMMQVAQQDTKGEWEYKVLRSGYRGFASEKRMREVLEAEARAEWQLHMKLDDGRLMLRRLRSARAQDAFRDPDVRPYRTEVGSRSTAVWMMLSALVALALGLGVALQFGGQPKGLGAGEISSVIIILGVTVAVALAMAVIKGRRR